MTKALHFTEACVRRAIAAARKEGASAVSIRPDGTIFVHLTDVAIPTQPVHDAESSVWEDIRA